MPILLTLLCLAALAGAVYVHVRCARAGLRRPLAALIALDLVIVVLVAAAAGTGERFEAWMQEDGWAEWATFIAFTAAAICFAIEAHRHHKRYWIDRVARWTLLVGFGGTALFCLVVAGEEISWGQRLFAIQPPEVFLQSNYQQELNVHNMLKGKSLAGLSLESKHLVALVACLYGLLYPLAVGFLRGGERIDALRKIAAPMALAPAFALVALAELTYPVSYTGEAAELVLGLAFLATALLHRPAPTRRSHKGYLVPAAATAAVIAGGLVLQPLVPAAMYGSDAEAVAQTRVELAQFATGLATARTDRLNRKRSVHKRVFTAVRKGYFDFSGASPLDGVAPDTRAEYFIDPWQNPYWVRWSREANAMVVYSFGPNRRRDTNIAALLERGPASSDRAPDGDDIAIVIDLRTETLPARRARAAL